MVSAKEDRPHFLYHPEPDRAPRWIAWPPLFRALDLMLLELRQMGSQSLSDPLIASELRRVMERVRPLAHQAGRAGGLSDGARFPGKAYTAVFFNETERWLAEVLGEPAAAGDKPEAL